MSNPTTIFEGASIVILGSFNPAIFQPSWFSRMELLRQEEMESATVKIITPEVAWFTSEWFELQVVQERFQIHCSDASKYLLLLDLVVGTFGILEHTPVSAVGLNSIRHTQLESRESLQSIIQTISPTACWDRILRSPRVSRLVIVGEGKDEDAEFVGAVQVTVEESKKAANSLYLAINEHHSLVPDEGDAPEPVASLCEVLTSRWSPFLQSCEQVPIELSMSE